MKVELFPFQQKVVKNLRLFAAVSKNNFPITKVPQIISFTAPTGSGKTIMMAAFVESVYRGDENYPAQSDAIFVWLSDSPELNQQSKDKFFLNSDGVNSSQLVTIEDENFNLRILEDGKIYFLNTQKLGKSSNLTKSSDFRQFTIWETLQNTILEKAAKLYLIIDEAHRGMKTGRQTATATTIMQKFIKGSPEDKLDAAPLVIGMSATPERFNALVAGTSSTIHQVIVTAEEVKLSGLLKEKIIVVHPAETEKNYISKDMAMLEAAADEWKNKVEHWAQYCREQHRKLFNPIFVVQVLNGAGDKISETDLDECLKKIKNRTGFNFEVGEVVHTFGQTDSDLTINNLRVVYEEPSHISGNEKVKIVFFKENLSTGWDCPQAETMMSFRRATDATYIAQLLGRMIRTPLQRRIEVDETLNEVRLYLPHFDKETAQNVVDELQKSEGGAIPTDIIFEDEKTFDTLTVNVETKKISSPNFETENISPNAETKKISSPNFETENISPNAETKKISSPNFETEKISPNSETENFSPPNFETENISPNSETEKISPSNKIPAGFIEKIPAAKNFNRAEIVQAINQMDLLTFKIRNVRINDYLKSLLKLAQFLTRNNIYLEAFDDVKAEIVAQIFNYIQTLKTSGEYEKLQQQAKSFKLSAQIFDAFGKTVKSAESQNSFITTDADIERQFQQAEAKLKSSGIANAYLDKFCADFDSVDDFKIDVIIFAANNDLESFAKNYFHKLNDAYRKKIAKQAENIKSEYAKIVADSDFVTEQIFSLPETIIIPHDKDGKNYVDHLFIEKTSGAACIKLNGWEEGILHEEQQREDFVCWLRNPQRAAWALQIPYRAENNELHAMYPDFLIIRRVENEYVADILEPHDPSRRDNIGKAKGLAEYAKKNSAVGRIELIRKDGEKFKRLDLSKGAIQDKIFHAATNNELDSIFQ